MAFESQFRHQSGVTNQRGAIGENKKKKDRSMRKESKAKAERGKQPASFEKRETKSDETRTSGWLEYARQSRTICT